MKFEEFVISKEGQLNEGDTSQSYSLANRLYIALEEEVARWGPMQRFGREIRANEELLQALSAWRKIH